MKTTIYYTLWAGMFALTAGLGLIPEPTGFTKFCLVVLSIGFFLPPALILKQQEKSGSRMHIQIIRNLAAASLILTILLIIVNFMSLMASEAAGEFLYVLLAVVSTPMLCGQYWVLSLFCWACLLLWSQSLLKKKK